MEDLTFVSEIFLFRGMDENNIKRYLSECYLKVYSQNDVIHSSFEPLNGIGVLVSGKAKIISGGDTLIRTVVQGGLIGAAAVFSIESNNRTSVVASSKCSVFVIPKDIIEKILENDDEAAKRYIAFLSDRISFLNCRISSLTAGDAVAKTAGFILSLEQDENGVVNVGDSFSNIASRLNMGRASLYRTIDRFVEDGLISRDKSRLVILDRNGLEDIILKNDPGKIRTRKV